MVISGTIAEHDYIDLGLPSGSLWATYNIGAKKVSELGDYFSWAEVTPKNEHSWWNLKYYDYDNFQFTKYCTISRNGVIDDITTLEPQDDVATVSWSDAWRMPTIEEIKELIENCEWKWTDNYDETGVKGYVGVSKLNNNSVFLPAAGDFEGTSLLSGGMGCYWTSSLIKGYNEYAYCFFFNKNRSCICDDMSRFIGASVRAVVNRIV